MNAITIKNDSFQMILVVLKYLSVHSEIKLIDEMYTINTTELKKFLSKHIVLPIELKNELKRNFHEILTSLDNTIIIYENEKNNIILTKKQICNLIKPIVSQAAHPADNEQLSQFFGYFECENPENEFFIKIL